MAKQKTGRSAKDRPTISIGIVVSKFEVLFPSAGQATMRIYGRSAGLAPGQSDLSSVMVEEVLTPDIRKMVDRLLHPHLIKKDASDGAD